MPITYEIDRGRGFITEVWTGEVYAADLRAHWSRYLADPEVLAIRRTLVDLRQCSMRIKGEELDALIQSIVLPVLQGRGWKTALVVEELHQFGVSRQYHVFAQRYSSDEIFYDIDLALEWLLGGAGPAEAPPNQKS